MELHLSITRGHTIALFKVITLGLLLGFGIQFLFAWTAPGPAAPGGNVAGPLTVGGTAQFKTAPLGINTAAVPAPGYGLSVAGHTLVGGKIYSQSTVAGDAATTVVTKDYLDSVTAGAGGLGVGQSWQYPARGLGGVYTNSTAKPIMVNISGSGAGFGLAVHGIVCYVNGVQVGWGYSNHSFGDWVGDWFTISYVVPAGSNYWCSQINSGVLGVWSELR